MKLISKMLVSVSGVALALAPIAAQAAPVGTQAGVDITNTVTINYNVGGVSQTAIEATDVFKVDRKIDLTVQTLDVANVEVSPGELNAVTTFRVTNNSNDTIDVLLASFNAAAGDDFDATALEIYVDTNNNGTYDAGTDVLASAISALASGDAVNVFIVSDMIESPGTDLPVDGETATVILQGTAATGVTAGTAITGVTGAATGTGGSALSQTPPATLNGAGTVETVFADAAGVATGDAIYDGKHSAQSTYEVAGADLTVTKVSTVISDPTGGAEPKAIPGAVVEYCILVTNGSSGATATGVSVTDPVPSQLVPSGTVSIRGPVAITTGACSATQTGTGSIAGQNVSGTLPDLDADEEAALVFTATIQ